MRSRATDVESVHAQTRCIAERHISYRDGAMETRTNARVSRYKLPDSTGPVTSPPRTGGLVLNECLAMRIWVQEISEEECQRLGEEARRSRSCLQSLGFCNSVSHPFSAETDRRSGDYPSVARAHLQGVASSAATFRTTTHMPPGVSGEHERNRAWLGSRQRCFSRALPGVVILPRVVESFRRPPGLRADCPPRRAGGQ